MASAKALLEKPVEPKIVEIKLTLTEEEATGLRSILGRLSYGSVLEEEKAGHVPVYTALSGVLGGYGPGYPSLQNEEGGW